MAFGRSPLEAEPSHRIAALLAAVDPDFGVAGTDFHSWAGCWTQKQELVEELAELASASSAKVVVSSVRHLPPSASTSGSDLLRRNLLFSQAEE